MKLLISAVITLVAAQAPPPGMVVGTVSEPLTAPDNSTYLIYLPPKWTATGSHPVMLFLHGVGGINNGKGCRKPGLTTQFPLVDPAYAAKVSHIVLVPVAKERNWRHHFGSSMALVDMAISKLGGDPSRVSIAGQSMGGHGAYLYASQLAPGRFCAVLAMCGYTDEDGPMGATVPAALLEPLKSTPIWLFHSEDDDAVPPPGQPQDDTDAVVKAFKAAGNTAIKYTRYKLGSKGPNYIPGHAAFELAFHDETLWPWLSAQKLPTPDHTIPMALGGACAVVWLFCLFGAGRLPSLAWAISTFALVASAVAFLGLQQMEGGLFDTCLGYSFVDVPYTKCLQVGAEVVKLGQDEVNWFSLVVCKARAENCFAMGMGLGALYALLFLAKGTKQVAVVHLMHAGWAITVCLANAQNAGLLPVPAEMSIDIASQAKLIPFVVITGVQAFLDVCAFLLSSGTKPPAKKKTA